MDKYKILWNKWIDGLKNTYRLVIMNDNTFEEVGSYRLTRLNIYIMVSSILVLVVILVSLLIAFTPLKEYVPGYGDVNLKGKAQEIERSLTEMEQELSDRALYIETIQRILSGDVDTTTYAPPPVADITLVGDGKVLDASDEEHAIRAEVERASQQFGDEEISISAADETRIERLYFATPLKGAVVRDEFEPHKEHYGIDLIGGMGSPVSSVLEGVVMMADFTYETGYVIAIQHSNNLVSFYKHNSKLLKKVGDKVTAGEAVAIIGNTGELTSGPHLHFELWNSGKCVNPRDYIAF